MGYILGSAISLKVIRYFLYMGILKLIACLLH